MEKIATRNGMRLEMYWADTASRGGLSRGLRRSILKGRCDVFMGVSDLEMMINSWVNFLC